MGRFSSLLTALLFAIGLTTIANAQTLTGGGNKANLDLPFDAGLSDGEGEDEDAPEIIQFYGQTFEGDGTFIAVDRSGSMQDSGELDIAKREISKMIQEFSDRVYFGLCFFDKGLLKFPASGRATEANPAMKAAAMNWVQTVRGGGGSCCQEGLITALTFANSAPSQRRVVVYVGDGGGTCKGANESTYLQTTLSVVKSQNYNRAQVNAIGVLNIGNIQDQFLRNLATSNNGTYTKVSR